MSRERADIQEFGDFQTPPLLAERVCRLLAVHIQPPATIIEPTCGLGSLLFAALDAFCGVERALGVDINPRYVAEARRRAELKHLCVELTQGDFFATNWKELLQDARDPILVVGNPPWVTNTHLSKLGSQNTPVKSNKNGLSGYDAISGKSNFDISEWMLVRLLHWLNGHTAVIAMLCKTSVARKVIAYAWRSNMQMRSSAMYLIDARESFGVSVDACLLVCDLVPGGQCNTCSVFSSLASHRIAGKIGYMDGYLLADVDKYLRRRELSGPERYRWRSGIKHDCSSVMELRRVGSGYINGLGEHVEIEDNHVFPLFKSSDVANGRVEIPQRYLVVPQRMVGDDTRAIRHLSPKTWDYLESHASKLDSRRSTIYSRQPRFAVFGIGDYSFAPWKVAVSGLYKQPKFQIVPPFDGKPAVFDDTCYFLACDSRDEALCIRSLLVSEAAQEFYDSFLFPDSKRPITADLLRRLDLLAVARLAGSDRRLEGFLRHREANGSYGTDPSAVLQPALFQ